MRKILNVKIAVLVILGLSFLACSSDKKSAKSADVQEYTCPMHLEIIRNEPGTCPICKMDLVPQYSAVTIGHIDTGLNTLVKPSNQYVLSGINTVRATEGLQNSELSLKGIINFNTNNWGSVSTKIAGRIEKLYIKYNYEPVRKGQKIMDVYSPDLSNAQQELLFLKNNGESSLLELAKRKLLLLGLSRSQIEQVLSTGKLEERVSIYSPYSGYVTEPTSVGSTSASSGRISTIQISSSTESATSSMEISSQTPSMPDLPIGSALQIREGQYVSAGQKLFNLINTDQVWAEFYTQPDHLIQFKPGQKVKVQSIDIAEQHQDALVSLIQPFYKSGSNFSLIRAKLSNRNKVWKVGQLIAVKKNVEMPGNWLPKTAVLTLGSRNVAFIKIDKVFMPVYVKVNKQSEQMVDIGNSVDSNYEFALNAWFLVDSESFIKPEQL